MRVFLQSSCDNIFVSVALKIAFTTKFNILFYAFMDV